MKTVLGLSVTAAGVGWVLVDGAAPVDDDKFVIHDLDELVPRCLAAVRGAQSIAASSGRQIHSIGVCWSQDVEDRVDALLGELRAAGCADVRSVRQVTPPSAQQCDDAVAERAARVDPCGLLAELLAEDTESDAEDVTAFVEHEVTCGPDAEQTSAYDAAQAVVTNAAPPEPVKIVRPRRRWTPENWTPENWTPPVAGVRVVSAAAVTAVIALFAVGSQFVGTGPQPGDAALTGQASISTAQTTQVVQPDPPAVKPMAIPEAAPARVEVSEPPVQLAIPQPQPVAEPSVTVEPPVSAVPLAAPPVPEAVPAAPVVPVGVPEPVPPVAAPLPVDQAAPIAPPEVLPPPPLPFWLQPPFVPPPPPPPPAVVAPEALAVPAEQVPPPAPPIDPQFGALP